jgi:hypothetical protein
MMRSEPARIKFSGRWAKLVMMKEKEKVWTRMRTTINTHHIS